MHNDVDFDEDYFYLYNGRFYKRLNSNGLIFLEILFDFAFNDIIVGKVSYFSGDEHLIRLPNDKELILSYAKEENSVEKFYSTDNFR